MIFYKTVAAGNDFLHIDINDVKEIQAYKHDNDAAEKLRTIKGELANTLCHRHTGPGADGVVFYNIHQEGSPLEVDFEIFNRDGSEAELSGNGMAGLTTLLIHLQKASDSVTLHTRVGKRTHHLIERLEHGFRLNIEIGRPDFQARHFFPFLESGTDEYKFAGVSFYPVSVGNPHVVVILESEICDDELHSLGEMLESAAMFPHHTNVEFLIKTSNQPANYPEGNNFRVFYYERGVGPTLASSTGSAAVFAVLQKVGFVTDLLTIPNGNDNNAIQQNQGVKVSGRQEIFIENSVKIVYKGIYI
jgi:diaminopimelate epimerase